MIKRLIWQEKMRRYTVICIESQKTWLRQEKKTSLDSDIMKNSQQIRRLDQKIYYIDKQIQLLKLYIRVEMYFSDYMHEWLYGEEGYYKTFKVIGKEGDFYTAVSTSAFFGASIANHLYNLIEEGKADRNGWLIEIGAHQGYLLCDMIQWLYTCDPSLVKSLKFGIVERQPEVQKAQLLYIKERFGDDIQITHFNDISDVNVDYAFVVTNEIFDAFPCELLKDEKIAVVKDHKIEWEEASPSLLTWAETQRLRQGEVAVGYEDFAKAMAKGIEKCDFVSFDYGEKICT